MIAIEVGGGHARDQEIADVADRDRDIDIGGAMDRALLNPRCPARRRLIWAGNADTICRTVEEETAHHRRGGAKAGNGQSVKVTIKPVAQQ